MPARSAGRAVAADGRTTEDSGRVALTHLDRVLYPQTGFTKGQMIDYYRAVAPVLLPHVGRRPAYLGRLPEGVYGKGWYQTNCRGAPSWMEVADVAGRRGATFRMCVVNDLDSLLWVANQGTIELHPLLVSADAPDRPVELVFDLDPGEGADLADCAAVALRVRELLADDDMVGRPKTSGSVGLHVVVGIDPAAWSFEQTRAYAKVLADRLATEMASQVTAQISGPARVGRVLIDWRQNEPMRSMIAPYSLRATPWPLVSTPLEWREVEAIAAGGQPRAFLFGPDDVLARVERLGDLFGNPHQVRRT